MSSSAIHAQNPNMGHIEVLQPATPIIGSDDHNTTFFHSFLQTHANVSINMGYKCNNISKMSNPADSRLFCTPTELAGSTKTQKHQNDPIEDLMTSTGTLEYLKNIDAVIFDDSKSLLQGRRQCTENVHLNPNSGEQVKPAYMCPPITTIDKMHGSPTLQPPSPPPPHEPPHQMAPT
jgi:hypothetical protein